MEVGDPLAGYLASCQLEGRVAVGGERLRCLQLRRRRRRGVLGPYSATMASPKKDNERRDKKVTTVVECKRQTSTRADETRDVNDRRRSCLLARAFPSSFRGSRPHTKTTPETSQHSS